MKIYKLCYTSGNFYPYFLIGFLILIISIWINVVVEKKEIFRGSFLTLVIIFCVELPYILTLSAFESGRTQFGIGALFSILIIYVIIQLEEKKENYEYKIKIKKFIYGLTIIYFVLNIVNYIHIITNSKIANKCEKEYVKEIGNYIIEYEKNNNVKIEKIQLVYDNNNNAFYDICTRKNVMTWNAVSCRWSAIGVINFYTNRNLEPIFLPYIIMDMDNMYEIIENVLYVKIAVR